MSAAPDPHAYDPPASLEGPDCGLVEAVSAIIWAKRASLFSQRVTASDFGKKSAQVKASWRKTGAEILGFLFRLGFTGPGGPPRDELTGWSYAWHEDVGNFEIIDDKGGAVALVMHSADLHMLLAAPRLATAARALLDSIEGTTAAQAPELVALRDALPPPATAVCT